MIPGSLDGMTRAEAWRNEYAIRRLAAIEREHEDDGRDDEPRHRIRRDENDVDGDAELERS